MQLGLNALFQFLDACTTSELVLATVVRTEGASYRKAGAMMLVDANNNTSGLVSGGCLEDDLVAHARTVFETSLPKSVTYDLSQEESASLWGLGLGCGGLIEILLESISLQNQFGGLNAIRQAYFDGTPVWFSKRIASASQDTLGHFRVENAEMSNWNSQQSAVCTTKDAEKTLSIPICPINRLLVCGAGPDAVPLVELAHKLSWHVIVTDPRPAHLTETHFRHAASRLCTVPEDVDIASLGVLQAAVIMTHNVDRDAQWLALLHQHPIPYIGLLGPAARRDQLLERAGLEREARLHGPAGLDIGATLPEEIALSILAQMHAVLAKRSGKSLA